MTSERQIRRIARLLAGSSRGVKGATFVFSPNRLYWTTRTIHPRRLVDRLTPALAAYFGASMLFFTGFAAFWAPLPLFLTVGGFASWQVFALYLVSSLASALLYQRAGTLAAEHDVRILQAGALAVRGALFPVVALVTGIGAAAVGFGVAGLGLAAIGVTWAVIAVVGTAIVTRLAPPSVRGEALGVYTALGAVAGGGGGLLGGWLAGFGYLVAFGVAGGFVLAGATLVASLSPLRGAADPPAAPDDRA